MIEMKNRRYNVTQPPGFPCPECGTMIHPTLDALLSARPVFCSGCGLKLTPDIQGSEENLRALKKLSETLDESGDKFQEKGPING